MASTFAITRNHLVFGLCLPLAVLLGYLLAEPFESTSLTVLAMVLSVLVIPLLMRWYHPLLVFSWYAAIQPTFLPGRPQLWIVMSLLGLLIAVLNRSVNPTSRFLKAPSIVKPMIALGLVVVVTGYYRGGFGLQILGTDTYGGKGYYYIIAAIAGYFALVSRPIAKNRAALYVAVFFLSGLTYIVGYLAAKAGPGFQFISVLLPLEGVAEEGFVFAANNPVGIRISGLVCVATAISSFALARFGISGIFDITKPWRAALLLGALIIAAFSGFRAEVLYISIMTAVLFVTEGLWRTRGLIVVGCVGVIAGVILIGFADRLPSQIQRAISFLPVEIEPSIRQSAEDSSQWRLDMWRATYPDIPKYLFFGKGYSLSPEEVIMIQESSMRGQSASWEGAQLTGDYHNGPLSVLIPFGIYGAAAFVWLLAAGVHFLYRTYQTSDPLLLRINAFLLSVFVARIVVFLFVFGALKTDILNFTGILGLSVALNSGSRRSDESNKEIESPQEAD